MDHNHHVITWYNHLRLQQLTNLYDTGRLDERKFLSAFIAKVSMMEDAK